MTLHHAYLGSLVADALAMPGHWYYDRESLRRDYGALDHYKPPKNPHPGSILWRSEYHALNEKGDILRDQAIFWGQRGIHYHQFLEAGENTVNFRLATELYDQVRSHGEYDPERWARRYIECMLTPGWHRDTYLEEYLAWKYHDQFDAGVVANAMVGGDNCHRGVVVGSILAAANGIDDRWIAGLKACREMSTTI